MFRPIFLKKIIQVSLLITLFVLTAANISVADSETDRSRSKDTFKIAIPYFKMISAANRYKILRRSIPEIIATGLIDNEKIEYVDTISFWKVAGELGKLSMYQNDPMKLYKDREIIDRLEIDLWLDGRFTVLSDTIKIDAALSILSDSLKTEDSSSEREISLEASNADDIASALKPFIHQLGNQINSIIRPEDDPWRLAFICFRDISEKIDPSNDWISFETADMLTWDIELDEKYNLEYVPLLSTSKYCKAEEIDPGAIMSDRSIQADILVGGTFQIYSKEDGNKRITFRPTIDLILNDKHHRLKVEEEITTTLNNSFVAYEKIAGKLKRLIEALIGKDGQWNIEALEFQSEDPKDYISKGVEFLKEGEEQNLTLASILFKRALDISKEKERLEPLYYIGSIHLKEGRYSMAERIFEPLSKNPGAPEILRLRATVGLASTHLKTNRIEKKGLKRLLKGVGKARIKGSELALAGVFVDAAELYLSAGELTSAKKVLEKSSALLKRINKGEEERSLKIRSNLLLGDIYWYKDKKLKAIDNYKNAYNEDMENEQAESSLLNAYLSMAKDLIAQNESNEALDDYLRPAYAMDTKNKVVVELMMYIYNDDKRYEDTEKLFNKTIKRITHPGVIVFNNAAFAFEKLSEIDNTESDLKEAYLAKAENAYKEAARLKGYYLHITSFNLGKFFYKYGMYEEALEAFKNSIEANIDFAAPYIGMGGVLIEFGKIEDNSWRFRKALEALDTAIYLAPDNATAHIYKGDALILLNRHNEASKEYEKALEIDSNNTLAQKRRDQSLTKLKKNPVIITPLTTGIDNFIDRVSTRIKKGEALTIVGQLGEAIKEYDKVLKSNPENIQAKESKQEIISQQLTVREKDEDKTDKTVESYPDDAFTYDNRGYELTKLGKHEEAIKEYEKAIEIDPGYALAYSNMGYSLSALGRHEEAVEKLRKSIEINPLDSVTFSDLGYALNALERHEEAIEEHNKSITLNPYDAFSYNDIGFALNALGRPKEAIKALDKAIGLDSENAFSYNAKGYSYSQLGKYAKAIEEYNKGIEFDPGDALTYNNIGFAYSQLDRFDEAIEQYNKSIKLNPDDALTFNNKGYAYSQLDKYPEAIAEYNKAIEINPTYDLAYSNKGSALNQLALYGEAIKALNTALGINPYDAYTLTDKGFALGELGRHKEAIEAYNKSIKLNSDYVLPYSNKGNTLSEIGRYEEAVEVLDKAIEVNPEYALSYSNKGYALIRLARYKEAVETLTKGIEIESTDTLMHSNRGFALHELGRYKEAIEEFDIVLGITPDDALTYSDKGLSLNMLGSYDEALEALNKSLQINPADALTHSYKGYALNRLKLYDKAIVSLDIAIGISPYNATLYSDKGHALIRLGRNKEAIDIISKGIEIAPEYSMAYYNLACVYALDGDEKSAITNLEKALSLERTLKKDAQNDPDFDSIRESAAFIKLLSKY